MKMTLDVKKQRELLSTGNKKFWDETIKDIEIVAKELGLNNEEKEALIQTTMAAIRIGDLNAENEYLSKRDKKPSLYICSRCENLITSMQALLCDKSRIEDASSEPHSITHTPEALRYAVMSRLTDVEGEKDILPFSFSKSKTTLQVYLCE